MPGRLIVEATIAAGVGAGIWSLAQSQRPTHDVPPPVTKVMQARAFDMTAAEHIFGNKIVASDVPHVAVDSSIKLIGVIVNDDPTASLALFDVNGTETLVTTGGTLPDGEALKSVSPLSVILAQGTDERMLQWEMHGATTNASFEILPVEGADLIANSTPLPSPTAKPIPVTPTADQLASLRRAALQVLVKRAHAASPLPPRARPYR